jgi:hypothetical protein
MLVRALKVLDYFSKEITGTDIDTAALDQPGDEGWAYDRGTRNWQLMNRGRGCLTKSISAASRRIQRLRK